MRRRAWKWGPPILKSETKLALVEIQRLTGLPWLVLTASQNITHGLRMFLHQHLSVRTLGRSHAVAGTEHRHEGDEIGDDGPIEYSLVRDFFAMADSSGTLVDSAGFGANAESDAWLDTVFSTVATDCGGAPLLVPTGRSRESLRNNKTLATPPKSPQPQKAGSTTFTTGGCLPTMTIRFAASSSLATRLHIATMVCSHLGARCWL